MRAALQRRNVRARNFTSAVLGPRRWVETLFDGEKLHGINADEALGVFGGYENAGGLRRSESEAAQGAENAL
jgi:hypothetical protein